MIDLVSTVRFLPSYPQLHSPVSMSKYGNRAISFVEYADPYRTIDMETVPMKASEAVALQAFIALARGGMETIVYRPTHICIPQAYWGNPNDPHITGTASRGTVTNGRQVQLTSLAPGLALMPGDLISFTSGTYRQMAQITVGATAASTQMTVTVDQPIAPYIASGAVVRFKKPELNTPCAGIVPDEPWASAYRIFPVDGGAKVKDRNMTSRNLWGCVWELNRFAIATPRL